MPAQGFAETADERLPLPAFDQMNDAQRAAAQRLIDGPRKAVFGPFVPLLRHPPLMERVGAVGEALRFDGLLDARVRELAICAVSRHVSNQFEWAVHAPAAVKAGVDPRAIDALREGRRCQPLAEDEQIALDLVQELLQHHGVCDATYGAATRQFGEAGVVELSTLVGYFAMVCWVMNVARTPADAPSGLAGFPL